MFAPSRLRHSFAAIATVFALAGTATVAPVHTPIPGTAIVQKHLRNGCSQLVTQEDHRKYAVAVYKRPKISVKAQRQLRKLRLCQHTAKAGRNTRKLERALLRDRRERQRQAAFAARISPPGAGTLAAIRACESGGNYSTNTGNGFYGAYQFDLGTWASVGGSGLPSNASPAEQDYRAALLYRSRGSSPWPVCGR